jgi:hypothetical protein
MQWEEEEVTKLMYTHVRKWYKNKIKWYISIYQSIEKLEYLEISIVKLMQQHFHTRKYETLLRKNQIEEYMYQLGNKHQKMCWTPLVIRKMQIITTVKYHFTPIWMAEIKTIHSSKLMKCRKSWWVCKWMQLLWKTVWIIYKREHMHAL